MTELIVDFASIRRGCEEDSAEQLVNVLYSLVCSLDHFSCAMETGKESEQKLTLEVTFLTS